MSTGGTSTSPPSSAALAAMRSQSSTAKYASQCGGTAANSLMPPMVRPPRWNSVYGACSESSWWADHPNTERIELRGLLRVRRVELAPAQRPRLVDDRRAGVGAGLPDGELRAGGILEDRHRVFVQDIHRPEHDPPARIGHRDGDGVGVVDGHVGGPRRRAACHSLRGKGAEPGHVVTAETEHGVHPPGALEPVFPNPPEQRPVEPFGVVGVRWSRDRPTRAFPDPSCLPGASRPPSLQRRAR